MPPREKGLVVLALGAALLTGGVQVASASAGHHAGHAHRLTFQGAAAPSQDGADVNAQPGALDDGKAFLPDARISLDQAVRTAQGAATGPLGQVDLEHVHGQLVFSVDIGTQEVKVDAVDGQVVAVVPAE